jgi:hypothetical protein
MGLMHPIKVTALMAKPTHPINPLCPSFFALSLLQLAVMALFILFEFRKKKAPLQS